VGKLKKVLITGASRGIGQAIANRFIQRGYNVLIPTHQELDLASVDSINEYVKGLEVDILINNAAENKVYLIKDLTKDNWQHIIDVNLTAPCMLIRQLAGYMMANKWGRIVNISSCYSLVSKSGRAAYSASKAGLNSLTRTAALEYAEVNILVNSICAGFVDTEMTKRNNNPSQINAICNRIPMKRLAKPDEIADFVYFIGSEQNTYITGQSLVIDGGFLIG
jgi:3-oxoacyl-[acyl-carrier protein] reductase